MPNDRAGPTLPLVHFLPSTKHFKPLAKMSRQSIEVHIQAIAREEREAARSQDLSQGVDDHVRRVLRAWTQVEYRNTLREGIDGQPEPEHLGGAASPCSRFVRLQVEKL